MKTIKIILLAWIVSFSITAQTSLENFFNSSDQVFKDLVTNGRVDYQFAKTDASLKLLIRQVADADLTSSSPLEQKAFYINAYNLLVIDAVATAYPISSVNEIPGFFDRKKYTIAGESLTLNKLEKERLIKETGDARLHFVLVCGAIDCPPIIPEAYLPSSLENQLERQTRLALNNPDFLKTQTGTTSLSKIFQWYVADFGKNQKDVLKFINGYRKTSIPSSDKIDYYEYNWQLNEVQKTSGLSGATNDARYVVSAAIPKGSSEIKIFNNLYSQRTGSGENLTDRSTFFTSTVSALYGLTNRFNAGIEFRYRRVNYGNLPSGPFTVFNANSGDITRQGITGIGPKVRIAPFKSLENFSIQSTLTFATSSDLAGNDQLRYIDWSGPTFNTQLFNDFTIGNNFSLFTELDFLLEDIGGAAGNHANRFSTPVSLIFSYFPNPKTTLYTLGGFSPYWQSSFDYFIQGGFGAKYQFTPKFELEVLYTGFTNKFLIQDGGDAQTINLGVRFNL